MAASEYLAERRGLIEEGLRACVAATEPRNLYEPATWVLEGGGKRLRPLLTLLTGEMYGAGIRTTLPAALAVEVFHNFTLVHDDIMDHADSRRGRDTVHVRWDEPTAILVGDLLMGIAYEQLSVLPEARVAASLGSFSRMVRRLCEGQIRDMAFESAPVVSLEEYGTMIRGKTGALIECAMELGAIVAGAAAEDREAMAQAGSEIGRAFQIQDDLLDLVATDPRWGKAVGGDLLSGKRTHLVLLALERASGADRDLLDVVLAGRLQSAQVPDVKHVMEGLDVLKDTRDTVIFHSEAAISALRSAPESAAREALLGLVRSMQARVH